MNNGFGIMDGDKRKQAGGGTGGAAVRGVDETGPVSRGESASTGVLAASPAGTIRESFSAATKKGYTSSVFAGFGRIQEGKPREAVAGSREIQSKPAFDAAAVREHAPVMQGFGSQHLAVTARSGKPLTGGRSLYAGLKVRAGEPALNGASRFLGTDSVRSGKPVSNRANQFLGTDGIRLGEPLPSMLSENESGELEIRVAFESMPSNKHSYEYFCTADPLISEEYKQKLEEAIKSNDFKALDELDNELREAYKSQEQQTRFAGFKIVRKDGLGRKTNLPGAAKRIEIETRGLSSKNLIRLPLKNGEYLELGLDENGNFSGKAVPLTKEGSNLRRAVSPQESDSNIVYNRYDTVLSDLQAMADVKMNGVDILPDIIKAIQQQKEQFLSHGSTAKQGSINADSISTADTTQSQSPLGSIASTSNDETPPTQTLKKLPTLGIRAGNPGDLRGV